MQPYPLQHSSTFSVMDVGKELITERSFYFLLRVSGAVAFVYQIFSPTSLGSNVKITCGDQEKEAA